MTLVRTLATTGRVLTQIRHDPRTIGLLGLSRLSPTMSTIGRVRPMNPMRVRMNRYDRR